jgi:Protein of unknown function (DUF4239)
MRISVWSFSFQIRNSIGNQEAMVMALLEQPWALFLMLLASLLVAVEIGRRVGQRHSAGADEVRHEQLEWARDAIGLLLSLLLGFTLAMALSRFDQRQQLIVDEANAIGTASLRAEMLPQSPRERLAVLLRAYVAERIHFSAMRLHAQELNESVAHTKDLQSQMWEQSVEASKTAPNAITSLFVQPLNEVIDLSEKRIATLENRVPPPIWIMLTLLSLLECLTAGMCVRRKSWFVMMISPLMIAIVMSLISDLNNPRAGFLQTGRGSMERLQQDLGADAPRTK